MRKILISFIALSSILTGCSTVQSIVRSTFPYTSTLIIPGSGRTGTSLSVTGSASSFDQIFTGQGSNTESVKEIRIASAKIESGNPSNQNLGIYKSIKLYISRGDGSSEVLVASRTDIGTSVGNRVVLDIDNSRFLDEYIKGATVRVRMEYVLRESLNADASVKATLGFTVAPATR